MRNTYMIKFGKSDGNAGLFSDNFKYGTDKLVVYLKHMFNMMIVHGKALTTCLLVLRYLFLSIEGVTKTPVTILEVDMFMLDKEGTSLQMSELQFGFKEGMSTDFATAVISETIDYYTNRSGDVYMLALDATKAFDRVD